MNRNRSPNPTACSSRLWGTPFVKTFTATAEVMIQPKISRRRRLWLRIRRKPLPQPIQPPGTRPLTIDYVKDGRRTRLYIPAARIEWDDPS